MLWIDKTRTIPTEHTTQTHKTEKLKSAGAAQESTKTLLEVVLGLKDKGKGKGKNGKTMKGKEDDGQERQARGRRRGDRAPSSGRSDGGEDCSEEEEDTEALEREQERDRERRRQRQQRERQQAAAAAAQEEAAARQRAGELAELKEYRQVLREELSSLWAAMGRLRPATTAPVHAHAHAAVGVGGQLDAARREALRLRRENDALVAELRDLDALILQAEAEGIDVFAPLGAEGSRDGRGGRKEDTASHHQRRQSAAAGVKEQRPGRRQQQQPGVGPTLEELIAAECEARLAALGARKGPGPASKSSVAGGAKPTRAVHSGPPSPYSPYLQLLGERGARRKQQMSSQQQQRVASPHHHSCRSPVPSPTPHHHLLSPSAGGSSSSAKGAPVFPREAVRRDGKTVYVRESKPIEDWIGSLRAPNSGGSNGPSTPAPTPPHPAALHTSLPPTPPSSSSSSLSSALHPQYRGRGGGGLSPLPSPSPGGLRVPRR